MLDIVTGFDGSAPHAQDGIEREGGRPFLIQPAYGKEDGTTHERKGRPAGMRKAGAPQRHR